jgi:hypothetical protein
VRPVNSSVVRGCLRRLEKRNTAFLQGRENSS